MSLEPLRIPAEFWDGEDVERALRDRDMGALFRLIRRRTGASQTQLGIATGLDQGYVSRIIAGRKVMAIDLLERIADGCAMPDPARWTMGLAGREPAYPPDIAPSTGVPHSDVPSDGSWRSGIGHAVEFWRGDVQRREVLRTGAFSAAGYTLPALRWFTPAAASAAVTGSGHRAVGSPDVATIREMTATFRRLDNQYGGGHGRDAVARYLHQEVTPLLVEGRFDATTGRALVGAVAEVTQLAGWQAYDTAEHGIAQRYFIHALRLAQAAGDDCLGAEILAAMSHQATYLGSAATGVDLARAAGQTAKRAGVRVLVAESAVLEAHAHARSGDARACGAALHVAERHLDRADRSGDPQWISYFDEAYLAAKFGHCFRALNQPKQAERFAARSLRMDNRYVRGRAFNLALLATAYAQQGEVEQACAVAGEALDLTAQLRSRRAVGYVRDVQSQLSSHVRQPVVRRFNVRVDAVLGNRR